MRVLVADQESDMLEALARTFDVDVATSKATCIDLLRANDFDVIVAGERLSDGSGLELLSHVGQRWPAVLRILSIEPERRALLKGRLGPFKLFETISWPIESDKLEAVLMRAGEVLARQAGRPHAMPTRSHSPLRTGATAPDPVGSNRTGSQPASRGLPSSQAPPRSPSASQGATQSNRSTSQAAPRSNRDASQDASRSNQYASQDASRSNKYASQDASRSNKYASQDASRSNKYASQEDARRPGARAAPTSSAQKPRNVPPSSSSKQKAPAYPPLPPKGSKIVPLGSPDTAEFRILPHDYHEQSMPGTLHTKRADSRKQPTLQEKAAALAAEAMAAVVRYIKPQSSPRKPPTKAPTRKKR
jgi:hypothetical protein